MSTQPAATRSCRVIGLLALLVFALALVVRLPYRSESAFGGDAAHYRLAQRQGFVSLYLGSNITPLWTTANAYLTDPAFRAHPWDALVARGDQLALSHFHAPFSFYPHALLDAWTHAPSSHRLLVSVFGSLCAPLVLIGLSTAGVSWPLSLAGAMLVGFDQRFILTSTNVSPHTLYITLTLACLFALARALADDHPADRLRAGALAGLSIASLELAPALVITAVVSVWVLSNRPVDPRALLRSWLPATAFSALATFVAWPGGYLKLGYASCYGFFLALSTLRREEYYPRVTALGAYDRLFGGNPLMALGVLVACLALIAGWKHVRAFPVVFVTGTYALLALVLNWRNGLQNATYSAEVTIFVSVFATATLGLTSHARTSRQRLAEGVLVGAAALECARATAAAWALTS